MEAAYIKQELKRVEKTGIVQLTQKLSVERRWEGQRGGQTETKTGSEEGAPNKRETEFRKLEGERPLIKYS